mgnify:CR=1 FL=1
MKKFMFGFLFILIMFLVSAEIAVLVILQNQQIAIQRVSRDVDDITSGIFTGRINQPVGQDMKAEAATE